MSGAELDIGFYQILLERVALQVWSLLAGMDSRMCIACTDTLRVVLYSGTRHARLIGTSHNGNCLGGVLII